MGVSPVQILVQVTLLSSAAVLLVGALRKRLRRTVGARAAYWLWMIVSGKRAGRFASCAITHNGSAH